MAISLFPPRYTAGPCARVLVPVLLRAGLWGSSLLGASLLLAPAAHASAPATADASADPLTGASGTDLATSASLVPIVVEAASARPGPASLAGISSEPLERTPLNLHIIGSEELLDRGVTSLSAAIRTDTSVGDNYNTFGYVEALQIRGFTLNELLNYQRDGLIVSSHVPVALENKERIEILKGSAGMMAGSSAPGGLVNYVTKQPTDTDLATLGASVSERGSLLLHGDLGGRLGPQQQWGYRLNLAVEERRPQIDQAWSRRVLASGAFDWRLSARTLLQFEVEQQKVREISVPGFALLDTSNSGLATTLPAPVDPRINLNDQPWTQPFESTATSASLRLRQQLDAHWDLALRLGTQRSLTNDRLAFPDGCSYASSTLNAGIGNYYLANGLCGNGNVDLYQYVSDGERRNTNSSDTRLHGLLETAGVSQELTLGLRTTRYAERYPAYQAYNLVSWPNGPVYNAFAPVALPANAAATSPNAPLDTNLAELYAYDVLHLGASASAWLGARYTRITQDSALTDGTQAAALAQHFLTPWLGLGSEPWTGAYVYASVGSGVEVSNVPNHPNFTNPGQVLAPQRSHQEELGLRQSLADGAALEATLFRIVKPFADDQPVPGATTLPDLTRLAGARVERHQGLELSGHAPLGDRLDLRASASVLDARTTQALDASRIGRPVVNTAPLALALQPSWSPRLLGGATWTNLYTYSGHKAVLPNGALALPSYGQWDTSLRYATTQQGRLWTWRAGIDNVLDRRYWREAPQAPWGSYYLFAAAGRSARVSLTIAF